MTRSTHTSLALAALVALACFFTVGARSAIADENWPQWRGPNGNGISNSTNLPAEWGPEQNIAWKTELPSWSGGTPIIWGDRIFITSPSAKAEEEPQQQAAAQQEDENDQQPGQRRGRGRRGVGGRGFGGRGFGDGGRDPGGNDLLLLCISKSDGEVLWTQKLDDGNRLYRKQNLSSPSPVTDGNHVWVVTGTGAVTAFDIEGNQVWQNNLQQQYGDFGLNWGYASSPLLHDGKLIIEVLHGQHTDEPSYIVALDAQTGQQVWRQERPTDALFESPDAYTTPVVLEHEGQTQIVVSGGDYVTGHDPQTGKELWRAAGLNPERQRNYRIIASPTVADGMIYAPTRQRPLIALRAGGSGDVTESHLAWRWTQGGGPDVPTPISDGERFYMVDDRGLVNCLDAKTGERVWGPLRTAQGTVSASPLLADGKLYVINESAVTTVIDVSGDEPQVTATNELDGGYTLSSIAVSGSQLFIRTQSHLYCIGAEQ
ncbi:MAG: PQQ-binding-like beta-propeller repeat protein [Pirellulales bacterium]